MSAMTIQLRPFNDVEIPHWLYFYKRIVWVWWLQRLPMFLLAIPASYSVGAFSAIDGKLPVIIAALAGLAFESTYIGAIALGDQMSDDEKIGRWIWFFLNIAAVVSSALFSTLYFAGGKYIDITYESVTHGALLPILNFFYGFLLHSISTTSNRQAKTKAEETKVHCEYCNIGRPNIQAVWSHYRSCDVKKNGSMKRFTIEGKPLT